MSKSTEKNENETEIVDQIAAWMNGLVVSGDFLYQDSVAYQVQEKFGSKFVYINENGNLALDRKILQRFRALSEGRVVWDKSERAWRLSQSFDSDQGRQV